MLFKMTCFIIAQKRRTFLGLVTPFISSLPQRLLGADPHRLVTDVMKDDELFWMGELMLHAKIGHWSTIHMLHLLWIPIRRIKEALLGEEPSGTCECHLIPTCACLKLSIGTRTRSSHVKSLKNYKTC
ncbi:hypothetical protein BYT27DRAFT_6579685 [Phlegmacium glaucopus]|nr:hypothetical protein BYT27DRAFT_6579685 [Phlegmacium glaucopus]